MGKRKLYMGYAWFNDKQIGMMNEGLNILKGNSSVDWDNSYRPLEHQYDGINVEDDPSVMRRVDWQDETVKADEDALRDASAGVFLYNPSEPDEGITSEIAFLYAIGKPTVLVIPDDDKTPINLMPAKWSTAIIKLSELEHYNFNKIFHQTYHGDIY